MLDTITLEFMGVSGTEDFVTSDFRCNNLTDDIAIGEANDKSILRSVVLVLGLSNETLSGIVVSLPGTTTLILSLIATTTPLAVSVS